MSALGYGAHFASSYQQARAKFLAAAAARGAMLETHVLPGLRGAEGEELALDVGRIGPATAKSLLVLTSATHGVEGFCGSGAQVALLHDDGVVEAIDDCGAAVLFVHALNPYGFSHLRRVNEDNVDLNRNFRDFGAPAPVNAGYRELHELLLPASWPPPAASEARLRAWIADRGEKAMQAAMTAGQSSHPEGLFFGGAQPTWSNRTLRDVLRRHADAARRIGWIDVHTGLGPSGHGEKIFAARDDAAALARARAWWGPEVTSFYDGSSTSAALTGVMFNAFHDECPDAEFTGIALEFGTVPLPEVLMALRAEAWLHGHPDAPSRLATAIRRRMRDAFYVDTDAWKEQVGRQARDAMLRALEGLR
jgi:Protein of unknown function (DUF2817)